MRFKLEPDRWYACEIIGDEFDGDKCSYSPVKVLNIKPLVRGNRTLVLEFYHANYPEGVRDKAYTLQTIERGDTFFLARSLDHDPVRILQFYDIDAEWLIRHFPGLRPDRQDAQGWLNRQFFI